ncbi:hypothetical protein LCGC14_2919760 [marine sediment metagenome]
MKTLGPDGRAVPFSIKVRTFQRNSKTGGSIRQYEKAKMVMAEENPHVDSIRSLQTVNKPRPIMRKNPNHYENKTRNIKVLPQGDIKRINIRFIIELNGQKVIY